MRQKAKADMDENYKFKSKNFYTFTFFSICMVNVYKILTVQ